MELAIEQHNTMQNNTMQNKQVVINNLSKWHSLQNRRVLVFFSPKSVGGRTDIHMLIEKAISSIGTLTEDTSQPWVNRLRRNEDEEDGMISN